MSCQNPINCHMGSKNTVFHANLFFPGSLTSAHNMWLGCAVLEGIALWGRRVMCCTSEGSPKTRLPDTWSYNGVHECLNSNWFCSRLNRGLMSPHGYGVGALTPYYRDKKTEGHEKLDFLTPYGNWWSFDKTEMSGNTLRNFIDPGSPMFCLTNSSNLYFLWFTVNWHFNVLEMAIQTFHICQGLPRTPLLFIPRYLTNICFNLILQKNENLVNGTPGNPKIQVH